MKRGGNLKRTPLARRTPLRNTPPERSSAPLRASKPLGGGLARKGKARPLEPGEAAWKRKRYGACAACGVFGRLVWHHLLYEQEIRREATAEQLAAGAAFDPRNALPLGAPLPMGGRCTCHADHHSAKRRLSLTLISADALIFACEILGYVRAPDWFKRYYQDPEGGNV